MIVLVGASASGKTEVAKMLERYYDIKKIITTTTRNKRINEVDGKDYFFISKEEFEKLIKENAFVEYTIYNGNYYGSKKDQIQINRCVVVDPNGLESYKKIANKNICSFALNASEEVRFNRMIVRGDSKQDAQSRINKDKEEFALEKLKEADYIINTEKYTIEQVSEIVYKLYQEFKKSNI